MKKDAKTNKIAQNETTGSTEGKKPTRRKKAPSNATPLMD